MEGFSPAGRSAGLSTVRLGGDTTGSSTSAVKTPHRSERSESGMVVGVGIGARFEQPGPEQGVRCSDLCSSGVSPETEEDDSPVMSPPSWLKLKCRSDWEETRWLQPAQAGRAIPRPWTKSSISASGCPLSQSVVTCKPHHTLRGKRETSRSLGPLSNLLYGRVDFI